MHFRPHGEEFAVACDFLVADVHQPLLSLADQRRIGLEQSYPEPVWSPENAVEKWVSPEELREDLSCLADGYLPGELPTAPTYEEWQVIMANPDLLEDWEEESQDCEYFRRLVQAAQERLNDVLFEMDASNPDDEHYAHSTNRPSHSSIVNRP